MADPTTNFGWDLPTVGGDTGIWGTLLNGIFQQIDDAVFLGKLAYDDTIEARRVSALEGVFNGGTQFLGFGGAPAQTVHEMHSTHASWATSSGLADGFFIPMPHLRQGMTIESLQVLAVAGAAGATARVVALHTDDGNPDLVAAYGSPLNIPTSLAEVDSGAIGLEILTPNALLGVQFTLPAAAVSADIYYAKVVASR